MKLHGLVLIVAATMAGCAHRTVDPAKLAEAKLVKAQTAFAKGDTLNGYFLVDSVLSQGAGAQTIQAYFAQNPTVRAQYLAALRAKISSASTPTEARVVEDVLRTLDQSKVFTERESQDLAAKFNEVLISGNHSGRIDFVIDDHGYSRLPALSTASEQELIFARTLQNYKDASYTSRYVRPLIQFARTSTDPSHVGRLRSALPSMNIRAIELDAVAEFDPDFAARRRQQISMRANLSVKNADRIFESDLAAEIGRIVRGVTWQDAAANDLQIVVEQVRSAEKELQEQSRTITYAQHQVDVLAGALLMPRNASYQFELKSGGAEIDYGYVISTWRNGSKTWEKILRGKVTSEMRRCENPRIVNVFGGVTSASFTANNDMRQACANVSTASLDKLRAQVMEKIAAEVYAIPEITAVTALN